MAIWERPAANSRDTIPVRREQGAEELQRQYLWNTPNGTQPDFSASFTDGDAILVSWNALNNSVYDLWLTSWSLDSDPVALRLARAVNLAQDGHLKLLTSNPPTAQMANQTKYALRFKPPTGSESGGAFVASDPDLSSPGFLLTRRTQLLQQQPPSSGQNTSSTATASPTRFRATTPSRETVAPAAGTDTEDAASTAAGAAPDMTPAAAAGLTIGLILVVALLVTMEVAYLMWRRKRRRRQQDRNRGVEGLGVSGMPSVTRRRATKKRRWGRGRRDNGRRGKFVPVTVPGDNLKAEMAMAVHDDALLFSPELPGDSGWGQRLVHELQGSRTPRGGGVPGRPLTINSSVIELDAERR